MSSVSWDRAPTRRASAETAACSACAAFSFARSVWTAARTPATSARTRSTAAPPSAIRSRWISRAWARARSMMLRCYGLGVVGGRLEELLLHLGEGGVLVGAPVKHPGQPDAAVELAVGAVQRVPGVGGVREVVADALTVDVVLQPGSESRPRAGQRLVGELDDTVVAGDQPGRDEQVDEVVLGGVADHQSSRDPAAHRLAVQPRGHQSQQHLAQHEAFVLAHLSVDILRRLGHRAPDPSRSLIRRHRQSPSLAAQPRLPQRMGEQRQGTRFALDLPNQQVHQPRLDDEADLPCGAFDRRRKIVGGHRGEHVQPPLHQPGEPGMSRHVAHPVSA